MTGYPPRKVAQMLGVTVTTLQRWDRNGKLKAYRLPSNHRYYTQDQIDQLLSPVKSKRQTVIYARVSLQGQKSNLKHQLEYLQEFVNARGIIPDKIYSDIGSGLNYKRYNWLKLLNAVDQDKIDTIYIAHPDRFVRFGFDYFKYFCKQHQTKIISLNNQNLSSTQEMIEDLVSVVHVFSCRLYGLRKYKKLIKQDQESLLKDDKND